MTGVQTCALPICVHRLGTAVNKFLLQIKLKLSYMLVRALQFLSPYTAENFCDQGIFPINKKPQSIVALFVLWLISLVVMR